MGGGASKRRAQELEHIVQQKDDRIAALEAQFNIHSDGKDNAGISDATYTTTPLVKLGQTKGPKNHTQNNKNQRRGEVSAEVMKSSVLSDYKWPVVCKTPEEASLIRKVMKTNLLFSDLHEEERDVCVDAFVKAEEVAPGTNIITQGDQGEHFYVIESGAVAIFLSVVETAPAIQLGTVEAGGGFGELALLFNAPRAATIQATTHCTLWSLERANFRAICTFHELQRTQTTLKILQNVALLKHLTSRELEVAAVAMEMVEYPANTIIIREGEVGEDFYVLAKGQVVVSKRSEGDVQTLSSGDYFGEMALLNDEVRSATCTSSSSSGVTILRLAREHFSAIFGSLQELMKREREIGSSREKTLLAGVVPAHFNSDIKFEQLEMVQTLGEGAFGRVKLVRHLEEEEHHHHKATTYALKCMKKRLIVEQNLEDHVVSERDVMLMLDHPFILRLYNTYEDPRQVYLLLELALGGELFTHLRKCGCFDESTTMFYIGSVVLAFQHIHERSLVYRDLKLENLILDSDGFLKIADFGLAKVCHDRTL